MAISTSIGSLAIKGKAVLGPMAGITDPGFRIICKRMGAGLIYTEMVNSEAIIRDNKSTLRKAIFYDEERPVAVQIFGAKVESMIKAARYVEDIGADIVDINMGCPDEKILRQGAGAALLRRPKRVEEIVRGIADSVRIPVTAKIRIGKDKGVNIAKIIEKAGASAIAVHARTVKQKYRGDADWGAIAMIKKNVNIPVIGNGDVNSCYDAKKMMDETGCDMVMAARGAMKNPFIFREINSYLKGRKDRINPREKLSLIYEYLEESKKRGCFKFSNFKRHSLNLTKSIPASSDLRSKIDDSENEEELINIIRDFEKKDRQVIK